MPIRLGLDLGGTKIEGIALAEDGHCLARLRQPTPQGDYAATLRQARRVLEAVEAAAGVAASDRPDRVGVGTPGAPSRQTGLQKNSNSLCLNGKPLRADLEEALGRRVRIANDANCLALSEATDGAGADAEVVFAAILGTGVGGGLVVHGTPLEGHNGIAGEWGHCPLPRPVGSEWPGPECYCGRRGCLETLLSGPGLAADHTHATGQVLSAREIAQRAERGDQGAQRTLARYAERLARGLSLIVNIVDPDVIVLGGGVSNIAALYAPLAAALEQHAFSDRLATPVRAATHGDSSGVRGAAWLWPGAQGHGDS